MSGREKMMKNEIPEQESEAMHERLQALFAAADPPIAPSEALRQRVAEVMDRTAAPAARLNGGAWRLLWRRPPVRIGLALAGTAALIAAAIGVAPTLVAAQVLRRVQAAITDARSEHAVGWHINPDGSRAKVSEQWYQAGRWRFEGKGAQIGVFVDGKLWSYEPRLNRVTVHRAEGPFPHTPSGFSVAAMANDFAQWGWQDRIRLLGDGALNGRRVHQVVIEPAHQAGRLLLLVDAATDLPIETRGQLEENGRWVTQSLSEERYNEPLPPELFQPSFPKSAPVVDLDHARQGWEQRLSKGIARQRVGDRTIVIRDVQVNADGDLFLLYTAGKYPTDDFQGGNYWAGRDWRVEVKDDQGTVHRRALANWATEAHQSPLFPNGYIFGGEKLEADWWVPVVPQRPWTPRRLTFTFHVSPINLHGGWNDPPKTEHDTETTTFTLEVRRPACERAPDYMPYMAMGDTDFVPWMMRSHEARVRASYYQDEGHDLPRALALYREVIQIRDEEARETGQPILYPQAWLDLARVLSEMGRKDEARAAYQQVLKESPSRDPAHDLTRREAEAALKAL